MLKGLKFGVLAEAKQGKGLTDVEVNSQWHAKLPAQTSFSSSLSPFCEHLFSKWKRTSTEISTWHVWADLVTRGLANYPLGMGGESFALPWH